MTRPARQGGAALLLALLVALTLALAFVFRPNGDNDERSQRTEAELAQAKAALIGYAATYRDRKTDAGFGYLPCPDLDNSGNEAPNCGELGETVIGRLPYRTLGIPPLRDEHGECLWYAVSGSHKSNPKSAPLNWDSRGSIRIVDVANTALADPNDAFGGATAAIIAPGAPLPGQNRTAGNGPCSGDTGNGLAAFIEGNPAQATPGTLTLTSGARRSQTLNDRINWISPRELFTTIAKRSDLFGNLLTELVTCLNITDGRNLPPADPPLPKLPYATQIDNRLVLAANGLEEVMKSGQRNCNLQGATATAWANWQDHLRYVICDDPGTPCINVNGNTCTGALLFAGRRTDGNPRTSAERSNLAAYFDAENVAALTSATANTFSGATTYDGKQPERDLAFCLTSELSFANNISDLRLAGASFGGRPLARVDTSNRTLTLGDILVYGNAGFDPAALSGCSWFGTPLALRGGLRAYFRYNIKDRGEGFVFALADADIRTNPGPTMCGRGGESLGYSGTPTVSDLPTLQAIRPPKLGLEIDTRHETTRNDPGTSHLALVFWGNPAEPDDDNIHGAPDPALPGVPQNTAAVSRAFIDDLDTNHHVRLEIDRVKRGNGATYKIRAWIIDFRPEGFDNLNAAFDPDIIKGSRNVAAISTTITLSDPSPDQEALRYVRLGFTNAAGDWKSSAQQLTISDFAVSTLPLP